MAAPMMRLEVRDNLGALVDVIEIGISNLSDFNRRIKVGGRRASFNDLIVKAWQTRSRRMFNTQGRYTDTPWPLYDETAERLAYVPIKESIFGREMTARDVLRWRPGEDRLYKSFVFTNARGNITRKRKRGVIVGSSLHYAGRHDRGIGRAPRRFGGHPIPRRPLTAFGRRGRALVQNAAIGYARAVTADFGMRSEDLPPPSMRRR
jgi:hypothetical protein